MLAGVCGTWSVHVYDYYLKRVSCQGQMARSTCSRGTRGSRGSCEVLPTALNLESGECVEDLGFYICWVILTTLCYSSVISSMEEIYRYRILLKRLNGSVVGRASNN